MAIPTDHPFQPGARVAIRTGYAPRLSYREAFVEKVYKTGHFVLKDDDQRWRPRRMFTWNDSVRWAADPTGNAWSRTEVLPWDSETDKEIYEGFAQQKRAERLASIRTKVERLRSESVSEAVLEAIESALTEAAKPKEDAAQ